MVLVEYVAHYNRHRPHQGRGNRGHQTQTDIVATSPMTDLAAARMRRRKVLGGLINEYEQAA